MFSMLWWPSSSVSSGQVSPVGVRREKRVISPISMSIAE